MKEHSPLTRQETAERLQVSDRTLTRWAAAGIGPKPIKRGPRRVYYDPVEVETFRSCGEIGRTA